MGIMVDFTCPNGHTTERFVSMDTTEIDCPDCDQKAIKVLSTPTIQRDKNSWKSVRDWSKKRENHIKYERKQGIKLKT